MESVSKYKTYFLRNLNIYDIRKESNFFFTGFPFKTLMLNLRSMCYFLNYKSLKGLYLDKNKFLNFYNLKTYLIPSNQIFNYFLKLNVLNKKLNNFKLLLNSKNNNKVSLRFFNGIFQILLKKYFFFQKKYFFSFFFNKGKKA